LDCEDSLYLAPNGALWELMPAYTIQCTPVRAWQIESTKTLTKQKCTLGGYPGSTALATVARENGMDRAVTYVEKPTGAKCGFLKLGRNTNKNFGMYSYDTLRSWSECHYVPSNPTMRRTGPDEDASKPVASIVTLTEDSTVLGRPHGWYTSGDEEVIIRSPAERVNGTSLIFGDSENLTGMDEYMSTWIFAEDGYGIRAKAPAVLTTPNSLQCRTAVTVSQADTYDEFRQPCADVTVARAPDEPAAVQFTTTSEVICTLVLGFQSDEVSSVVTLKAGKPVTTRGADRWRCLTSGEHGTSCGGQVPFGLFVLEAVPAAKAEVVTESDMIVGARAMVDPSVPGVKAPGYSWIADIIEAIKVVATLVTIVSILITLIKVAIYFFKRHKAQQEEEEKGQQFDDVEGSRMASPAKDPNRRDQVLP
jgi:hypothetical protein